MSYISALVYRTLLAAKRVTCKSHQAHMELRLHSNLAIPDASKFSKNGIERTILKRHSNSLSSSHTHTYTDERDKRETRNEQFQRDSGKGDRDKDLHKKRSLRTCVQKRDSSSGSPSVFL